MLFFVREGDRTLYVIERLSTVIHVLLWLCFTSLCDWLKKVLPLSQPIRSKNEPSCVFVARVFLVLDARHYVYLPLNFDVFVDKCLCLLWLTLVWRHLIEKRFMIRAYVTCFCLSENQWWPLACWDHPSTVSGDCRPRLCSNYQGRLWFPSQKSFGFVTHFFLFCLSYIGQEKNEIVTRFVVGRKLINYRRELRLFVRKYETH